MYKVLLVGRNDIVLFNQRDDLNKLNMFDLNPYTYEQAVKSDIVILFAEGNTATIFKDRHGIFYPGQRTIPLDKCMSDLGYLVLSDWTNSEWATTDSVK